MWPRKLFTLHRERRELRVFRKLLGMIPEFEDRLMSSSEEEIIAIASMVSSLYSFVCLRPFL